MCVKPHKGNIKEANSDDTPLIAAGTSINKGNDVFYRNCRDRYIKTLRRAHKEFLLIVQTC